MITTAIAVVLLALGHPVPATGPGASAAQAVTKADRAVE